ncbi:IS66 family insertion sequence element accessory protein TnpB [Pseudoalteromonas sp.]|uniref:IS66 family insertion sequence element accessory protein TnpB n=1 Tax=Pseudoalteromonas sp. TaxID=53249 RepID=UPI0030033860
MKMFVEPSDIYLHRPVVDFRKSINGLANIVVAEMNLNVMSGALFIFCNKSKDKLKILYWDKTGFALWHKRLENNKFKWPNAEHESLIFVSTSIPIFHFNIAYLKTFFY